MKPRPLLVLFVSISLAVGSGQPQATQKRISPAASARPYWIGISVPDAEATAAWYQEKLHFKIRKTMAFPEHNLRIVFLELNGFNLELIEGKATTSFEAVKKRIPEVRERDDLQGFTKLGFMVSDVDALAGELKRAGVKIVMQPTDDPSFGVRQFLIEDNAGNVLQFFHAAGAVPPSR